MEALCSCSQSCVLLGLCGMLWPPDDLSCCADLFCNHFFFSFSRPSISHTDLFTCLSLPLTWHLFNRSGYLRVSRHSSVFGKNAAEGMTVTSVQRIHVTATQTFHRKE